MQRDEIIAYLKGLGLRGMASSFDDVVTTGIQKGRTIHEKLTDLLRAETASRHGRPPLRYAPPAASHGVGGSFTLTNTADHSVGAGQPCTFGHGSRSLIFLPFAILGTVRIVMQAMQGRRRSGGRRGRQSSSSW